MLAWYIYGAWPVPEGYSSPRHSMFGGPDALFAGSLEDVDGCIRTAGDQSFAAIGSAIVTLGMPVVATQEGGYAIDALGANAVALLRAIHACAIEQAPKRHE